MLMRVALFLLFLFSLVSCRTKRVAIEDIATVQHTTHADTLHANISWLVIDSLWQADTSTVRGDSVTPKLRLKAVRHTKVTNNTMQSSRSTSTNADSTSYIYADYPDNASPFPGDDSWLYLLFKIIVVFIIAFGALRLTKQ